MHALVEGTICTPEDVQRLAQHYGPRFTPIELQRLRTISLFVLDSLERGLLTPERKKVLHEIADLIVPLEVRYVDAVKAVVQAIYAMPEYTDDVALELCETLARTDVRFVDLQPIKVRALVDRVRVSARGRQAVGPAKCVAELARQCGAFGVAKAEDTAAVTKRITNAWIRMRRREHEPVEIESYVNDLVERMRDSGMGVPAANAERPRSGRTPSVK